MLDLRTLLDGSACPVGVTPHAEGQEYVSGWGVFALPFESGDVLALRVFQQTDFGPYVAVWHRDPRGRWAIYVDGNRLDTACPRYFGPACDVTAEANIRVAWTGRNSLRIQMGAPRLDWTLTARTTRVLTLANAINRRLRPRGWSSGYVARARELMARCLGMGRVQLIGEMPSGHVGQLRPERMYFVDDATAQLDEVDLGRPVHLRANPRIGAFRLPSRGVLVKGGAVWDILDPVEYARTLAETSPHRESDAVEAG